MVKGVRLETIEKLAGALPGVVVGTRWTNRTWFVNGHGFVWQRPLSAADLKRYGDDTPPAGDLVAVMVDGLDGKDALLGMGLPGFFTIAHFQNYPAVLVELRLARLADVKSVIHAAYELAVAKRPRAAKPPNTAMPPNAAMPPRAAKPRAAKARSARPR